MKSNIPGYPGYHVTKSGLVYSNKRSLSRILLLHPNTINRVLNKPQDYEY